MEKILLNNQTILYHDIDDRYLKEEVGFVFKIDHQDYCLAKNTIIEYLLNNHIDLYPKITDYDAIKQDLANVYIAITPFIYGNGAFLEIRAIFIIPDFFDKNDYINQVMVLLNNIIHSQKVFYNKNIFDNIINQLEAKLKSKNDEERLLQKLSYRNLLQDDVDQKDFIDEKVLAIYHNIKPEEIDNYYQNYINHFVYCYYTGPNIDLVKEAITQNVNLPKTNEIKVNYYPLKLKTGIDFITDKMVISENTDSAISMIYTTRDNNFETNLKAKIISAMLGETFSSDLNQIIREKYHLVYVVYSRVIHNGIAIVARIKRKNFDKFIRVVKEIITTYQKGVISERMKENFIVAKNQLKNGSLKSSDRFRGDRYIIKKHLFGSNDYIQETIDLANQITLNECLDAFKNYQLVGIMKVEGGNDE